jgi:hypothetical protein
MATISYPLQNGDYHSFASVELKVTSGPAAGQIFPGVKSVNAKDSLTPTKVRGAHSEPLGRTRGDYDCDGDLEMYVQQAHQLLQAMGAGYKQTTFDISITFSEANLDTVQHQLIGCRIQEVDSSNAVGTDASTLKFTLNIMKVLFDGLESLTDPLAGASTQN